MKKNKNSKNQSAINSSNSFCSINDMCKAYNIDPKSFTCIRSEKPWVSLEEALKTPASKSKSKKPAPSWSEKFLTTH